MKRIILFISVLFVFEVMAFDMNKLPHYSSVYDKTANPHKDLSIALQKVKKSDKKVLLLVGGDWCKWCGTLDNFFEDNEKIANEFYSSFEVVRVYYGKGMSKKAKSLLIQFPPIKATPHFYILDKNAKLLQSISTEYLERGYGYNKTKVIEFIKKNKRIEK